MCQTLCLNLNWFEGHWGTIFGLDHHGCRPSHLSPNRHIFIIITVCFSFMSWLLLTLLNTTGTSATAQIKSSKEKLWKNKPCLCRRQYTSSGAMKPTWSTFSLGMWAEQQLHFSLRLMTGGLGEAVEGRHLQEEKVKCKNGKTNTKQTNTQKKKPAICARRFG